MVKILNCYLNEKKSYGTLPKGAIFLANSVFVYLNKCNLYSTYKNQIPAFYTSWCS